MYKRQVLDLLLPVIVLIALCVVGLIWTGGMWDAESDNYHNLSLIHIWRRARDLCGRGGTGMTRELICIGCPMGCRLTAEIENGVVTRVTVSYTHLDVYKRQFP